jgi:LysR family nitrogen assimilation transcriptional regulator
MDTPAKRHASPSPYDLVQLRYVQTIVACGNMTTAARQLRVSQPTLSNAVRRLEARLGTPLLFRGPRGVAPTASGKALVRAADEVFALLRQTDEQLRGIESAPSGHFVIGCYHSFGAFFLPELVVGLATRVPAIELSLWEGTGARVVDAVIDRTVSFGVGVASAAPRPPADLVVVPMFRDVMCVVRATRRPPPNATLFYVPRISLSERVVDSLRSNGQLPDRVVACGDLELVKSFVMEGAGLGVLPWRVATHGTPRGAVRLVDPKLPFEVDVGCLFYRSDLHRTRGALLMRDEIVRRGSRLDAVPMPCGAAPIARSGPPRPRASRDGGRRR